jgi:beta-lactamase class A
MKTAFFRSLYCIVIALLIGGVYMASQPPKRLSASLPTSKAHVDKTLQDQLMQWADGKGATYAISVQELTGQERVARVHGLKSMPTASTYKLFVAYGILHGVEQGSISLQDKLASGDTIHTCLRKMIVISDNTCGRALGFKAGWAETEKLIAAKGMIKTYLDNYDENDQLLGKEKASTSQDHTILLRQLYAGELLNKENTDILIGYMKKQQWRERIPAGIPDGIEVADKPGFLPHMQNDAAIVYGPKSTYTITVLSDTNDPEDLANISKLVYTYLQK